MDQELLRLALVNHAIGCGAGAEDAWRLVDTALSERSDRDVRALADAVRDAVRSEVYPWAQQA